MNRAQVRENAAKLFDVGGRQKRADVKITRDERRAVQDGGKAADHDEIDVSVAQSPE